MELRKVIIATAVSLAMVLGSGAAVAAKPASGSASVVRAAAPVKSAEQIKGSTAIVSILALAAVIGGLTIGLKKNNRPASP